MLLIAVAANGQARIGFTEKEIRQDGTFSGFTFTHEVTTEGIEYLQMQGRTYTVLYYFKDGVCTVCAVVPKSDAALSGIVEVYNSTLVVVNATRWMQYLTGGILECDLMQTESGVQYFRWRRYEH